MATVAQMITFMNEEFKADWWPKDCVEVFPTDQTLPGYEGYQCAMIKGEEDRLYLQNEGQKWIGHYYVMHNQGNGYNGIILLPTNNRRFYVKAEFNIIL